MDAQTDVDEQIARITVAGDRQYLAAVRAFLREAGGTVGLAEPDVAGLERAVEEVCVNVLEHGFEAGQAARLDVVLLRRPGQIVVAVEDQGRPFDFAALQSGKNSSIAVPSLMEFADTVRFQSLGRRGNRVEIGKRLPFDHIETYVAGGKAAVPIPQPSGPSTEAVSVRLMTPDDAIAVAQCTYAVYGYTLPDDYLYFPERMREMLAGGLLEMCVAETASGEIVGYLTCELERPGAPVGYMEEGLVDPRFRHRGLLEEMLRFMQRRAAGRGMLGLLGEAVTVHPYSQKSNLALGFTEMGVQLGDEAPSVDFKSIENAATKKRTATILNYLKTIDPTPRTVYAPPHHRAMIERVYAHGAFPRDIRDVAAGATAEGHAAVQVDAFPGWSEASIRVTAYGADLANLVRARLRELCLQRVDWICVDLPLSHPMAGQVCAPLEAMGFFFAGVVPDLADDDVLRLQYLNEVDADVESAQIASEFGKELYDYVVQAMRASSA